MQKRGRSGKQYYNPQSGRYSSEPYAPIRLQDYDFPLPPPPKRMNYAREPRLDFNATQDRLLSVGGMMAIPANDTVVNDISLPIQILPDGSTVIAELIRFEVYPPGLQNPAAGLGGESFFYTLYQDGGVPTDTYLYSENCIVFNAVKQTGAFNAGSVIETHTLVCVHRLDDGAGHGILVTKNLKLTVTSSSTAATDCLYKLWYKLRVIGTGLWVSKPRPY